MVRNCSTSKANTMLPIDLKDEPVDHFLFCSKLGFNCLNILNNSVVRRGSLRRGEWLETAQHVKLNSATSYIT